MTNIGVRTFFGLGFSNHVTLLFRITCKSHYLVRSLRYTSADQKLFKMDKLFKYASFISILYLNGSYMKSRLLFTIFYAVFHSKAFAENRK